MDNFAQSLAIGRTQRHLVNRMRQTLAPSSLRGLDPATIEGKCHGLLLRARKRSHHHGQARTLRPDWRHVEISSLRMSKVFHTLRSSQVAYSLGFQDPIIESEQSHTHWVLLHPSEGDCYWAKF